MISNQPAPPANSVGESGGRAAGRALLDRERRFVEIDEAMAAMHGLPREAHLGRSVDELLPSLAPAISGLLAQVLSSGQPIVDVLIHGETAATNGERRAWMASYYPVRSRGGTVVGVDVEVRPIAQLGAPAPATSPEQDTAFALLDTLFAHAPTGLAFLDRDYRYVRINEALATLNGASVEAHLGRTVREVLPDLAPHVEPIFARVLQTGEAAVDIEIVEEREPAAGGRRIWRASYYPIRLAHGQVAGLGVVANDITVGRRAAEELRLSEERFRIALHSAQIVVYTTDRELRYTWIYNPHPNFVAAEVLGRRDEEMLPAAEAAKLTALKQRALDTGAGVRAEVALELSGRATHYAMTIEPLRGPDGSLAGLTVAAIDITARLAAEAEREALLAREREARARAERTAAQLAQLQAVTDALARALTPAQVAEVVVQRSAESLGAASSTLRLINAAERTLDTLASVGMPAEVVERWRHVPLSAPFPIVEAVRSGSAFFLESREDLRPWAEELGATVDGLGYEAFAVVPLQLEGRTIGSLALTFDGPRAFDSEDRSFILALAGQCAQALERARLFAAEQAAVEMRDTFIAVATHDLRTPITALLGQAQLLERRGAAEGLSERAMRSARAIAQAADRLNRMIGALLDLSRIQLGRVAIEPAPLDLAALARRIVGELQPTLPEHRLTLEGADEAAVVAGDELRLEQVIHNLLGNAVKYSPAGGAVRLRLEREAGQVSLHIADEGVGISPEALPHLFERFYRAPGAANDTISGLGVGLYVVREIVALHGGAVSVASAEGAGSTFTVSLPAA